MRKKYLLSVLIPSRSEEFLARTVQSLIENKTDDTEIIVGLDGELSNPPIPDHDDLTIFYVQKSIGQRAMQNKLCELSKAKYVMKLDAHCDVEKDFDRKMIEAFEKEGDNVVMTPTMRNLHIFNWVCKNCGMDTYQGPKPEICRSETCVSEKQRFDRKIVWIPKTNPQSTAYRFNKNLQFKYFPELRVKQKKTGCVETMSLQGSCFMCTIENYWKYELCDDSWGSWGQQGSEVAIKAWTGGLRVLCNRDTWYAHLFRTQPGFDHPFNIGSSQHNARKICRDIFYNNKWDKQIYPLSWLVEKFWPELQKVRDPESWTEKDLADQKEREKNHPKFGVNVKRELPEAEVETEVNQSSSPVSAKGSKGIIFYTCNTAPLKISRAVQSQLRKISEDKNIPIVSCSLKPMPHFGNRNICLKAERGVLTMFKQILTALENSKADIIFHTEHDVIYSEDHFDFVPPRKDKFYYNVNFWKVRLTDDFAVSFEANQVSGLCAYREHLLKYYRERVKEVENGKFDRSFEPGRRDNSLYEQWKSIQPNVDIRHGKNLSGNKWSPSDFRDKSTCVNWREGTINDLWCKDILINLIK